MKTFPAKGAHPVADEPGLIFQWERRTRAHWRLAVLVALSLLAHAIGFYVVQVSYTPTGSQLPPPAQVVFIPPDAPGGEAFSRWLAMADPSLIAQPVPPTTEETLAALDFRYVPSYATARPGFKPLDPAREDTITAPPRSRPPGPVPLPPAGPVASMPPPAGPQATRVQLTGGIEARLLEALPPVAFTMPPADQKAPEPSGFLVGVRPEGGPPYVFQMPKADHTAADDYARDYLASLRFRPAAPPTADVQWGSADFAWGNDLYR